MKKLFNALIIIFAFLMLTACNNYKDFTFELKEDNTYEITKYLGEAEEVTIPAMYKGKKVTSIGNSAFHDCSSLTNIVIPANVTSIGSNTFANCNDLTSITIPNNVTYIGDGAFFDCIKLKNIVLPDTLVTIGESSFWGCTSLTDIIIPDGTKDIGAFAFAECTNLNTVVIPTSIETLQYNVFQNCYKLSICIKSENIPVGWSLGFDNGIKTTILGFVSYGVTEDGFEYGISKINDEYFASIVGYIEGRYTSINIPNQIEGYSVKRIASSSFNTSINLTSIAIPNSIVRIESNAFSYCENLNTIIIPESVTYMGRFIFTFTENVTIRVRSESKPEGWHDDWNDNNRPVIWGYTGE